MLITGGILAGAFGAIGLVAWWLSRARAMPSAASLSAVAAAMWIAAMIVFSWRHEDPRGGSDVVPSPDVLAWSGQAQSSLPVPPAASPTGVQAASVDSLVGGLEARLAAQPNDAAGWALLAQSYAYTANEEAVERAIRRAAELGADEQQLRERVASAKRSAPHVDWVERAIGQRGR
jgi:hypothetical protein